MRVHLQRLVSMNFFLKNIFSYVAIRQDIAFKIAVIIYSIVIILLSNKWLLWNLKFFQAELGRFFLVGMQSFKSRLIEFFRVFDWFNLIRFTLLYLNFLFCLLDNISYFLSVTQFHFFQLACQHFFIFISEELTFHIWRILR